jgi:hypothetical protein
MTYGKSEIEISHQLIELQGEPITNKRITVVSLDSSSVKVHPDATGALKTGNRLWGSPLVA